MTSLLWPAPGYAQIKSGFGKRIHPITRKLHEHNGVDVPCPAGTELLAPAFGRVSKIFIHATGGLTLYLDHAGGIQTRYCHLKGLLVELGDSVACKTPIAWSGGEPGTPEAGGSTGAHLHLSVLRDGVHIDPLSVEWVNVDGMPVRPEVRR